MTRGPDFDELVGPEPGGSERARLRHVHDLLVQAGPPAELPPELTAGPTLRTTLARRPRTYRRRAALLAAAVVAVLVVFLGGYITGNRSGSSVPAGSRVLRLHGTSAAPGAVASLRIEPANADGNWPMTLSERGLPALPDDAYYAVYLVRDGKPYLRCGVFTAAGKDEPTTVSLSAPDEYHAGDTWIVTKHVEGATATGPTVLAPAA